MSLPARKPGFDDLPGSRNRRLNRYVSGNSADRRHKEVAGTTIGFDTVPTPDEITDSGNGLGVFEVNEVVETQGSTSNDGQDVCNTVAAGAIGVLGTVTLEVAGAAVTLRSFNNRRNSRFS